MAKKIILGLVLFIGQQAFSQTKVHDRDEQLWFGYFNQTRFTNKSGMWLD